MKNTAVYPGSFNPWHAGHQDILDKALKIFDKVIILQGHNTSKSDVKSGAFMEIAALYPGKVECGFFNGLLVRAIEKNECSAIIRGLRSGYDLEYETNNQYWNEDLGCETPFIYFICDRRFSHISSSAIRELENLK